MTFRSNYNASNAIPYLQMLLTSDELKPRSPSIRRLREAKGWSRKDLAKKVGCSQQAISSVEKPVTKDTRSRYFAASPPY